MSARSGKATLGRLSAVKRQDIGAERIIEVALVELAT